MCSSTSWRTNAEKPLYERTNRPANFFNPFLKNHVNSTSTNLDVPITQSIYGQFRRFVLNDPNVNWQTSMNYLSSVRRQLEDEHKTTTFKDSGDCINDGTLLKNRAPAMALKDLKIIGELLFIKNETRYLTDRAFLAQQWTAIGRSSDIGSLRFSDFSWKDDCSMHFLAVLHSALIWQLDPIHALAAQLIGCPYDTSGSVFRQIPVSKDDEKHFCNYINRLLRSVSDMDVDGRVTAMLSSHSTRRGAATVGVKSGYVNLADLSRRGQWSVDSYATLMEYPCYTSHGD
ncbi:hypothetical protein ACHHYP_16799 [Achlya hypogyna]|uniref:Uncharacterized protein n=1 Tax=Achlya hypogyna TaxID=1202772 RepID=A0A1V9Y5S5_ACHHY|nr:hypothetical protein ACHHYP_16799 [Achlya hypogyna]